MAEQAQIEVSVQQWLQQCVIGLSLCPFAKVPWLDKRVRLSVCNSASARDMLTELAMELVNLTNCAERELETTLLILPAAPSVFLDFNDFVGQAESLLEDLDHQQQFQLATFHPRYQFADVAENDLGNYTNKAPYPIIQILRESSVSKVVDNGETDAIPERNIQRMQALGQAGLDQLFPWVER